MKKRILFAVLALTMLFVLSGCVCEHQWVEANCLTPKTCSLCEETEGDPLGHDWLPAECTQPEHCSRCEETVGEALGHTWVEADCVTPKTCSVCAETEGEALGHTWEDATCVLPKTCSVCAATEGEALGHTWEDATCVLPKTCSVCAETEGEALGHAWAEATCVLPKTCSVCAETEGEALGHTWEDATCVLPKTCSVCAETEGEAMGHTWQDATCAAPETCSLCGETQGEALPHTFGHWSINGEQMTRTCSGCQKEETTATDYSVYLDEALSGEWIATYGYYKDELYHINAGINQQFVAIYLNFLENGKVQYFSEGADPQYQEGTWQFDEASFQDATDGFPILVTTENDTHSFAFFDENGASFILGAGIDPFELMVLTREADERVANSLSESTWVAITKDLEVFEINFAEDYTFTGYRGSGEITGSWHIRNTYATEYSVLGDIVVTYQKDGRPCILPLKIYYSGFGDDMDAALKEPYIIETFNYENQIRFNEISSYYEVDVIALQQKIVDAPTSILGTWNSVQTSEYSGENSVREANTSFTITFLEDGTYALDELLAQWMGLPATGTWQIESMEANYQGELDLDLDFEPSGSSKYAYGYVTSDGLHFNSENLSVKFVQMSDEEKATLDKAAQEADTVILGDWTSLTVRDYSQEQSVTLHTSDYQLTFLEDGTFMMNDAFVTATGKEAGGTWKHESVELSQYGQSAVILQYKLIFADGSDAYVYLQDDEIGIYINDANYDMQQLTPEEIEAFQQADCDLIGTWTSVRKSTPDEVETETDEYTVTFAQDGTFVTNEALGALLEAPTGKWSLYGRDEDSFECLIDFDGSDRRVVFDLFYAGELEVWHYVGDEIGIVYLTKD